MTTDPDERPSFPAKAEDAAARQADAGRLAEARSVLSAVDRGVFGDAAKLSRAAHRIRFAAIVGGFFGDE